MRTLLAMCLYIFGTLSGFAETLVLNNPTGVPFTSKDGRGFLNRVATEAFTRAGYRLRIVKLPAERGLYNVNRGADDGDLSRIAGLEKIYPNLIRVDEKLFDMEFVAISLAKKNYNIKSWNDLKRYNVAIIRGWKILEYNIPEVNRVSVRDAHIMFRLLRRERVDVVCYSKWMSIAEANRQKINIRIYEPALASRPMYIYLHKKHKNKVAKIRAALQELKQDGTYDRIRRVTLETYLRKAR